jgi:hypothetical protein
VIKYMPGKYDALSSIPSLQEKKKKKVPVVHACNTWEAEIWRFKVSGQPGGKKISVFGFFCWD